ncbi:MAG: hypothetical protein AAF639_29905 [Chloroflexota bacterium]
MKKTFNQWNKGELQQEFNLQLLENCEYLNAWLAMPDEIPIALNELEQDVLELARSEARIYIEEWNEWDLRDQFIGIIVKLAKFNDAKRLVSAFSERTIGANVQGVRSNNDIELSGKVDWMVASGMGIPKKPFFFIHEYKQEGGGTRSNSGQLLATMLAAQELNDDGKPMYGAYIVGRNWFFVVLQDRTYCMTDAYVSTKEHELQEILRILKAQKLMINERV